MTKLGQQLAIGYYRTKFKVLSAISNRKAAELALDLFTTPHIRNKNPLPDIFAAAEKLQFKHYGETVTGYRWNHGGHRKALIVHGFNSSVAKFDQYIKPLIKKGYEVMAFDAPAHGYSTGKTLNAVVFKEMIIYIIKEYGPVKSIMGHSFGCLAICLALEESEHNEDYRVALIAPATESKTAIDIFFSFMKLNNDVRKEFDEYILRCPNPFVTMNSIFECFSSITFLASLQGVMVSSSSWHHSILALIFLIARLTEYQLLGLFLIHETK